MNELKTIAVVGAGFTGRQIAAVTVENEFLVKLCDIDKGVLEEAKRYISGVLKRKSKMDLVDNINYVNSISDAVSKADLIIEAVPENIELKLKVFKEIDNYAPPSAIISTNSSSFPVSKFEKAVKETRKVKLLNIHFYPPISKRPMADIMRGTKTNDETFQIGKKWIEAIKCTPLEAKRESYGFVFNRVWRAAKRECIEMWAGDYADPAVIDEAWKIFTGMDMGPFTMMDGIGLDVVYAVEQSYYENTGDPRDKPPKKLEDLVKEGNLGIKSGKGFYTYRRSKRK